MSLPKPEAAAGHRRFDLPMVAVLVLCVFPLSWFAAGVSHRWEHPLIGWLALPLLPALGWYECRRTSRDTRLDRDTRRFWAGLSVGAALLVPASIGNMADVSGGTIPVELSPFTLMMFGASTVVVMWTLLRLPAWQRSSGDWLRFGLDTGIVLLTGSVLIWHLSPESGHPAEVSLSALMVTLVSVLCLIPFVKIAFAGAGQLDRRSLCLLAAAVAASGTAGALAPVLPGTHLTSGLLAYPLTLLGVVLAARRQRRAAAGGGTVRTAPRRFSLLPYLAIAVLYAALLKIEIPRGGDETLMALAVTVLTGLVVLRQITTLRTNAALLDRLDHEVTHDPLTGIGNRHAYLEEVSARLTAGEPVVVALLDLDDFKDVNDRFGHHTGDDLLRTISDRVRRRLRPQDTVARLGGDEFTLLLPGMDEAATEELLRGLLAAVQEPVLVDGHEMAPRVSVGVTSGVPGDSPIELLRRADVAMYAAKSTGGGRRAWFDPIMDQMADLDARLAADLRQAIARDELSLVYQPIVELPGGGLAGVETLVRWRHPEHGMVSPAVFVPLAERNGYIVELGRWVLEHAVRQTARWRAEHGDTAPGKVSVNVSARQLSEPGFPEEVAALLAAAELDPALLVVEVTETAVIGTGIAFDAVRRLDAMGVRIALDDFGTGHSSLSLLVECPVSWLKVDKSFVDGVTMQSPQAVIVDGLIGITRGLRMHAVAEGVETADQARRLHEAGYRFAQGYHFARPMPAADLTALLTTQETVSVSLS
ncbi:putative bifunctional diguanylate cyclase/phosphodiesterase [Actinoplanes rectilineatus]|uniref:putative bifunctional diguanylate cyclase/phosphodiesterase n=1 Tax=Actinoplanes rectilineatus TaxID=113571 RepID=UPI0005F2C91F|nr:EAL domain-containing protein [Actinoplanes rectilineatus]